MSESQDCVKSVDGVNSALEDDKDGTRVSIKRRLSAEDLKSQDQCQGAEREEEVEEENVTLPPHLSHVEKYYGPTKIPNKLKCKKCQKDIAYHPTSYFGLKNHYKSKHPKDFDGVVVAFSGASKRGRWQGKSPSAASGAKRKRLSTTFQPKHDYNKAVDLCYSLIMDTLPMNDPEVMMRLPNHTELKRKLGEALHRMNDKPDFALTNLFSRVIRMPNTGGFTGSSNQGNININDEMLLPFLDQNTLLEPAVVSVTEEDVSNDHIVSPSCPEVKVEMDPLDVNPFKIEVEADLQLPSDEDDPAMSFYPGHETSGNNRVLVSSVNTNGRGDGGGGRSAFPSPPLHRTNDQYTASPSSGVSPADAHPSGSHMSSADSPNVSEANATMHMIKLQTEMKDMIDSHLSRISRSLDVIADCMQRKQQK